MARKTKGDNTSSAENAHASTADVKAKAVELNAQTSSQSEDVSAVDAAAIASTALEPADRAISSHERLEGNPAAQDRPKTKKAQSKAKTKAKAKAVPVAAENSKDSEAVAAASAAAAEEDAFDAKAFLRTVPNRPGCYRMYGDKDQVIYVGKAKDLKKRLSSYFMKREQNRKTTALVSHIKKIEFTVTFSESEALILENELIKKYQPHYNILLRDDKSYPYLHLTSDQEFPGIYFHRGARRKDGEYFGPFPDATAVKDSLRLLQKIFPIRQCLDGVFAHRSRPCLMAQMGKCLAPCVPMSAEQVVHYKEQVDLLRLFLQGHNQELLQSIVAKMEQHAQSMEFEEAARLRDQLTALRKVQESNSIVSSIDYPLDVIGFAQKQGMCCVHVLFIRNGRIFGTRSFFPQHTNAVAWSDSSVATAEVADTETTTAGTGTSTSVGTDTPQLQDALEQNPDIKLAPRALDGQGADDSVSESKLSAPVEILLSFLSQFYLNESHSALIPDEVVVDFAAAEKDAEDKPDASTEADEGGPASEEGPTSTEPQGTVVESTERDSLQAEIQADLQEAQALSRNDLPPLARPAPDLHVSHHRGGGSRRRAAVNALPGQPLNVVSEDADEKIALASQLVAEVKSRGAGAVLSSGMDTVNSASDSSSEVAVSADAADASSAVAANALGQAQAGASGDMGASEDTDAVSTAVEVLREALKARFDKNVRFIRGLRGSKKRFVQLAMTNAQVALRSRLSSSQTAEQRVRAVEQLLGLSNVQRMECYDISHTMGELTVGSCVVFNREGPDSMRYRRYNISGITAGDDFAAMHQVLTRRFRDPDNAELPDLIFIDGGPGQLKQAEEVLTEAFKDARSPMPAIVAVAKGEGRKEGLETLIRAFSHERIHLDLGDPALQLVLHIRDEAHRFAITGHRNRRAKARRSSSLEEIAGVGPKRRQALLQHLGGMQEVKRAGISELAKVPGISRELAQKIYEQLHGA